MSRVHECNVWVRACGQNVRVIMEDDTERMTDDYYDDYSDYEDYGCGCCGCGNCGGSRYRQPLKPSEEWLAACPALAWANMRLAANARPPLAMLLGPEE